MFSLSGLTFSVRCVFFSSLIWIILSIVSNSFFSDSSFYFFSSLLFIFHYTSQYCIFSLEKQVVPRISQEALEVVFILRTFSLILLLMSVELSTFFSLHRSMFTSRFLRIFYGFNLPFPCAFLYFSNIFYIRSFDFFLKFFPCNWQLFSFPIFFLLISNSFAIFDEML